MPAARGRAWTMERASMNIRGHSRPRSNKYSGSDSSQGMGECKRARVGGYKRADGTHVKGLYRTIH